MVILNVSKNLVNHWLLNDFIEANLRVEFLFDKLKS